MKCFPWLHFMALLLIQPSLTQATNVNVVGLFTDKAVVSVDGGRPQVLTSGDKPMGGVRLLSADSRSALLEIDGHRQTMTLGQSISAGPVTSSNPTVSLTADIQGHFLATGSINGATTRFLVDTGASFVSMSAPEARRLGISYLSGQKGMMSTANGVAPVYRIMLDTVKLGDITLHQVEAAVHEGNGLPVVLLGMSFLNRLAMKREGTTLTLVKRY